MFRRKRITIACLASIAIPIATAWLCVVLEPGSRPLSIFAYFGNTWPKPAPASWPAPARSEVQFSGFGFERRVITSAHASSTEVSQLVVRAGWPLASFEGWQLREANANGSVAPSNHWAIPMGSQASGPPLSIATRLFPLRPTWGLLGNAALWSVLVVGPIAILELRRTRRFRAGRCVRCGHQLLRDQSVCPECRASRHSA